MQGCDREIFSLVMSEGTILGLGLSSKSKSKSRPSHSHEGSEAARSSDKTQFIVATFYLDVLKTDSCTDSRHWIMVFNLALENTGLHLLPCPAATAITHSN